MVIAALADLRRRRDRGQRDRRPARRRDLRWPRPATRSGSACSRSGRGLRRVRARAVPRAWRGRRASPGRSRSPGSSSTATRPRSRSSRRWPTSPGSAGRANHLPLAGAVRLAVARAVAVVAVVLCAVGIEAFARRDIGATQRDPDAAACRAALVGPPRAGRPRRFARTCRRRWRGASGSACSGCSSPARARSFAEQLGSSRRSSRDCSHRSSPNIDFAHGRRLPAAAVRRVRADPGRARRGDARRPAGHRTRRPGASSSCSRRRGAGSRWLAVGGLGRLVAGSS